MRKEVVQKLFKLFALAQSQQTKGGLITTQGIGLGLSISKQLLEKLGGRIRISTVPNQGTEVKFTFPYKCFACMQTISQQNTQIMQLSNFTTKHIMKGTSIFKSYNMNDASADMSEKSSSNLMKQPPNELVTPPISNRPWQPFGGDINIIPSLNTKAKNTTSGSKGSSQ
jgi:hypothetical protein